MAGSSLVPYWQFWLEVVAECLSTEAMARWVKDGGKSGKDWEGHDVDIHALVQAAGMLL